MAGHKRTWRALLERLGRAMDHAYAFLGVIKDWSLLGAKPPNAGLPGSFEIVRFGAGIPEIIPKAVILPRKAISQAQSESAFGQGEISASHFVR